MFSETPLTAISVRWSRVCPPGPSFSLCWGAAHSASPASSVSAVNVDAVKEEVVEEVVEALEVFSFQEEEAVVEAVVVEVAVEVEGDAVVEDRYLISNSNAGLELVQFSQL